MACNNTAAAFKTIKDLTRSKATRTTVIEDKNGNLLTEKAAISNRWKEYCEEPYNYQLSFDKGLLEKLRNSSTNEEEAPPILTSEVDEIKGLKDGNSPGIDNVPVELLNTVGIQQLKHTPSYAMMYGLLEFGLLPGHSHSLSFFQRKATLNPATTTEPSALSAILARYCWRLFWIDCTLKQKKIIAESKQGSEKDYVKKPTPETFYLKWAALITLHHLRRWEVVRRKYFLHKIFHREGEVF